MDAIFAGILTRLFDADGGSDVNLKQPDYFMEL